MASGGFGRLGVAFGTLAAAGVMLGIANKAFGKKRRPKARKSKQKKR